MTIERRALQLTVAIACLVPLTAGSQGIIRGVAYIRGTAVTPDLDSHFRYLSGIFLMMGIGFVTTISRIETQGARFRLLGAMVVCGGLSRALSWALVGAPSGGHKFGLMMELGVVPILMLWQARVARLHAAPQKSGS
ncbi:protein of unknown function [Sphingomonas sp. YR710]|uniref:DUF4345 domain-containing protein n=1 Tax=Sphingomonas sp. YR710 TaxID=1882773 RepID=UPI0008838E8A|nr:DUF4345 domain-containing protein [Sphingomonas sp. YR710]SDC10144.1 protein of unknown function [Sphingomonas sp. YR710]